MLTGPSYALIIGAGAGKPYGFPLGDELYQFIRHSAKTLFTDEDTKDNAKLLSQELRRTCGVSIDRYLNINRSLKDIGVLSMVAAIHLYEKKSIEKLPFNNFSLKGDWYTYLYKKMIQGLDTPEDLLRIGENKVSFITFNYDRSLEHYLFSNLYGLLKNAGISEETVAEKFAEIKIIHVYGKTGYLPWEKDADNELIVPYGHDKAAPGKIAIQSQKMINLIYDERKGTPELKEAKKLISDANRIMFLGFGYDEMNLSMLGMPDLLQNKAVFGTALESTKNEISQIVIKLASGRPAPNLHIIDCDCLMLLKENLV